MKNYFGNGVGLWEAQVIDDYEYAAIKNALSEYWKQ